MSSSYENLGSFYLGREFNAETGNIHDDLVLYDSKDLVTHGVVLGMTGSGKTGLCMAMLEEAAMDYVPAIIIDPKGDIANLMLTFPNLAPADFRPWINEDDATKKGIAPDEYAEKTAAIWKKGLSDWAQAPERIATLQERVEINIFTPGSNAGIPVSILSSLQAPPFEVIDDTESLGDQIESTVSSMLTLIGVDADPIQSPEAILLANIFAHEWRQQRDLSLESIISHLQKPPFDKVGVIDVEGFLPAKKRQELALKFNHLLASPGFSTWLEGPPLDIAKMLCSPQGKPRMSIFSIAHLSDSERMFFVSLLLNQTLSWMRRQSGTTSLRAILYMDEIFGYLPPSANPPSKKPMMTLLKQARAFGLGCLFATQNPVDLDYKALSNIGSWFLGRLQTERDKLRVLDGLEGASASQNSTFHRSKMEVLLSGLGNRIFLMNNVHDDSPVLFHVRWVMSYLAGPLTKMSIKRLMDPKRHRFDTHLKTTDSVSPSHNPMALPLPTANQSAPTRPAISANIKEAFGPITSDSDHLIYQPYLMRVATVHYSSTKAGIEYAIHIRKAAPMLTDAIAWDREVQAPHAEQLQSQPAAAIRFAELPGYAMNASNYQQVKKDFVEWLYRNERLEILFCPKLNLYAQPKESEEAFRARISHKAREARDETVQNLRKKIESKIDTLERQKSAAERTLAREKGQADAAKVDAGISILGSLLSGILGGRRSSSAATTVRRSSRAYQQHQDVAAARQRVDEVDRSIAELENELALEITALSDEYNPLSIELETETIQPTRANVDAKEVSLLWMPINH